MHTGSMHVKGSVILHRFNWFEERGGDAAERVLSAMAPEDADVLRRGVFAGVWYPIELFLALSRTIDRVLGRGDLSVLREIGAVSALVGLRGTYGVFVKPGHPELVFKRAPAVWGQFYDSGRVSFENEGPTTVRLILADVATPALEVCAAVHGWIEGMLQFTGVEGTVREERCVARGDARCEYVIAWKG